MSRARPWHSALRRFLQLGARADRVLTLELPEEDERWDFYEAALEQVEAELTDAELRAAHRWFAQQGVTP